MYISLTEFSNAVWLGNIFWRFDRARRSVSLCYPLWFPRLKHTISNQKHWTCALYKPAFCTGPLHQYVVTSPVLFQLLFFCFSNYCSGCQPCYCSHHPRSWVSRLLQGLVGWLSFNGTFTQIWQHRAFKITSCSHQNIQKYSIWIWVNNTVNITYYTVSSSSSKWSLCRPSSESIATGH